MNWVNTRQIDDLKEQLKNKARKLRETSDEVMKIWFSDAYTYPTKYQAVAEYNQEYKQYENLKDEFKNAVQTYAETLTERL